MTGHFPPRNQELEMAGHSICLYDRYRLFNELVGVSIAGLMQRALVSFCLWYMKTLSICATILLTTLMACDKPVVEKGEGDLLYANVQTPKIASVNQGIVSQLRVTGPN